MKNYKFIFGWLLASIFTVGMLSCGGSETTGSIDDIINGEGNGNGNEIKPNDRDKEMLKKLIDNKWVTDYTYCNETKSFPEYLHENSYFFFKNEKEGIVTSNKIEYDKEFYTTYIGFEYSLKNGVITFQFYDDNQLTLKFKLGNFSLPSSKFSIQMMPYETGEKNKLNKVEQFAGKCGDNLEWYYSEGLENLYIKGFGPMYDYNKYETPWNNYNISNIIVLDNVTSIGEYAFSNLNCDNLKLGNKVKSIGMHACENISVKYDIEIPNSVEEIDDMAFKESYRCSFKLQSEEQSRLKRIGKEAFAHSSIDEFTFPKSLRIIDKKAFDYCSFYRVDFNEGLEEIGDSAFVNQVFSNVSIVEIPNSVKHIGESAFEGEIGLIVIGSGLKSLGKYAFRSSGHYYPDFYISCKNPPVVSGPIIVHTYDNKSDIDEWTLHVPYGCSKSYMNAAYWKDFGKIVEGEYKE